LVLISRVTYKSPDYKSGHFKTVSGRRLILTLTFKMREKIAL
jgi:hypothetical protein